MLACNGLTYTLLNSWATWIFMPVMLADYDPGTLSGLLVGMLFAAAISVCIIGAVIMSALRKPEAARALLKVAGICFLAGFALIFLTVALGRVFHWL
jgi:hypothetical protein